MFTMWPGVRAAVFRSANYGVAGLKGVTQPLLWRGSESQVARVCGAGLSQAWPTLHTVSGPRLFYTTALSSTESSLVVDEGERDLLYSLVEVECRGHEPAVLRSYLAFLSSAATHLGIQVKDVKWPKKHIYRWTLLKSVHIHKKHRVQYETRTHFLTLGLPCLTQSTADTFLEYIQRNLPEGIAMKVTKHELTTLPQHVKPSSEVVSHL